MSAPDQTDLCAFVAVHAGRVRELLDDLKTAKIDSREWQNAVASLEVRSLALAERAEELAALCKKEKAV